MCIGFPASNIKVTEHRYDIVLAGQYDNKLVIGVSTIDLQSYGDTELYASCENARDKAEQDLSDKISECFPCATNDRIEDLVNMAMSRIDSVISSFWGRANG